MGFRSVRLGYRISKGEKMIIDVREELKNIKRELAQEKKKNEEISEQLDRVNFHLEGMDATIDENWELKTKIVELRDALRDVKPIWPDAPEWAKFLAASGTVYWDWLETDPRKPRRKRSQRVYFCVHVLEERPGS